MPRLFRFLHQTIYRRVITPLETRMASEWLTHKPFWKICNDARWLANLRARQAEEDV
jgi:hypothetical protein